MRPVPLVTLPLGATRERIVGTLSVADALDGDHEFDPGLLARAHRGVLYVDEVNLLDDHLVDVLLSAAASGVNRVERDGISVTHPAEFTLVGTMNPEEGDLRPQLRDRFALQTTVTGCSDLDDRVEIIDQALDEATETPDSTSTGRDSGERLRDARDRIGDVVLERSLREDIAELCRDAGVDGHRGDIATARTARALAALDGRDRVEENDVETAARFALPHRLRAQPFEDAPDVEEVVDEHFDDEGGAEDGESDAEDGEGDAEDGERRAENGDDESGDADAGDAGGDDERDASGTGDREGGAGDAGDGALDDEGKAGDATAAGDDESADDTEGDSDRPADEGDDEPRDASPRPSPGRGARSDDDSSANEQPRANPEGDAAEGGTPLLPGQDRADVGEAAAPELSPPEAIAEPGSGTGSRASASPSVDANGSRVRTERTDAGTGGVSVDAAASVRAASARGASSVESRDLRQSVRAGDSSALVLFVVDASASMRPAMRAAKGTVLELLEDAYQHRDAVGFVAFAGTDAEVLLPPTDSVTLAARHLKSLPTGDRTPLPAGLRTAGRVLDRADPAASVVVVVTDGRANVADGSPVAETRAAGRGLAERDAHVVVVAAGEDDGPTVTDALVEASGGERVPLAALSAARVDESVREVRDQ